MPTLLTCENCGWCYTVQSRYKHHYLQAYCPICNTPLNDTDMESLARNGD